MKPKITFDVSCPKETIEEMLRLTDLVSAAVDELLAKIATVKLELKQHETN